MHPNMAKLLGLNVKPVFHSQTWPTPVNIPYVEPANKTRSEAK